jgi:hypothetical protein
VIPAMELTLPDLPHYPYLLLSLVTHNSFSTFSLNSIYFEPRDLAVSLSDADKYPILASILGSLIHGGNPGRMQVHLVFGEQC